MHPILTNRARMLLYLVSWIPIAAFLTAIGWIWPEGRPLPRLIALPSYAVSGNIAVLHAWIRALGGQGTALWEPTRRGLTSRAVDRASRPV